jgi:hypothetical protein
VKRVHLTKCQKVSQHKDRKLPLRLEERLGEVNQVKVGTLIRLKRQSAMIVRTSVLSVVAASWVELVKAEKLKIYSGSDSNFPGFGIGVLQSVALS